MLLKKQTVWLLTMLSLVAVLSVYYITSPEPGKTDLAGVEEKGEEAEENAENAAENDDAIITAAASDEVFEELRMEAEDDRSRLEEELNVVVASTDLPAEQRSEAQDQLNKLQEVAQKEAALETLIKAMNYEDVLVRADNSNVQIIVKADEPSRTAANDIIREVKKEIGDLDAVVVEFQVKK